MKNFVVLLVVIGLAIGVYKIVNNKILVASSNVVSDAASQTFSLPQIAEHSSATSCYLAIDGIVFDVTRYIASGLHPGGDEILQGCGKDATTMFTTSNRGRGHSAAARALLAQYRIGTLAN